MDIRPATPSDAEALTALARASKGYWNYPPAWIEAWREALTFTPDFIAGGGVFLVSEDDRAAACYALTAGPPEEPGALELQHFWLDPDHIGKG
ncbi:MAG: GNAT family N-acetyltransferase, partial [Acidobacteriota bacterium]